MTDQDPSITPGLRPRGRAATSNRVSRYDRLSTEAVDDGWDPPEERTLRTEVRHETPRSVITRNSSPDIAFDRSINPYRGCEHGCIYCFARPTHAYLGLSPGLDFETKLIARPDADKVLARELARRSYRPAVIAIGTNTDPYQPVERDLGIMRKLLEVLAAHDHPVAIVTKGALIERDIDILSTMAGKGLAKVGISITTLDDDLARRMEPRTPRPARRLAAIRRLAEAGVPVRVMFSPAIPGLNDHEMERVLAAGRQAGAQAASMIALRLPLEVSPLFRDWLEANYPARAAKVMGHVRGLHGGRDYDPEWGKRMKGSGPMAELMQNRFALACRRLGLARDLPPLRTDLFAVPGRGDRQLSLF